MCYLIKYVIRNKRKNVLEALWDKVLKRPYKFKDIKERDCYGLDLEWPWGIMCWRLPPTQQGSEVVFLGNDWVMGSKFTSIDTFIFDGIIGRWRELWDVGSNWGTGLCGSVCSGHTIVSLAPSPLFFFFWPSWGSFVLPWCFASA